MGLGPRGQLLRLAEAERCRHILLHGSGAEALHRYVAPNLLLDARDRVSAVVVRWAAEGPDHQPAAPELWAALLAAFVPGHDVQVYHPGAEHSLGWAWLEVAGTPAGAAELAGQMAVRPVHDPGQDPPDQAEALPARAARALLEALLLDLTQRAELQPAALLARLRAGRAELAARLSNAGAEVRARATLYFSLRQDSQAAVLHSLATRYAGLEDPNLARASAGDDAGNPASQLDLAGVGRRPTLLYLCLPPDPTGQLLYQRLVHDLSDALHAVADAHGGALPQHVSVYLDGRPSARPDWAGALAEWGARRAACHLLWRDGEPHASLSGAFGHRLWLPAPAAPEPVGLWRRAGAPPLAARWPRLDEARAGRGPNPLHAAYRQQLGAGPPDLGTLERDLVVRRLLAGRAALLNRPDPPPDPALVAFARWADALPAHSGLAGWPVTRTPLVDAWLRRGWLTAPDELGTPSLRVHCTPAGWAQLGPARLARLSAAHPAPLAPAEVGPVPAPLDLAQTTPGGGPLEAPSVQVPASSGQEAEAAPEAADPPDGDVPDDPVAERQQRIMDLLSRRGPLTPAQVVAQLELPETTVRRDLNLLEAAGQLSSQRVSGKRRYRLTRAAPVSVAAGETRLTPEDAALLDRIRASNVGPAFARLYDQGQLGRLSHDQADIALCAMLFVWVGPEPERLDRLFRTSALMRPQWDEPRGGQTYGQRTLALAQGEGARPH